ncbi:hypothetical protein GWI33_014897 [Rhynchophorus ferrugineus]|uniref:C2H2-type domain-containing protein n=1 Tax=Rhynchophorus ferrugineus TaxID=354439 RepID=A0A834I686_RHYFE|nr:hypothetical protein GWI33_014897 [Rhynchophorus ferrugineus]
MSENSAVPGVKPTAVKAPTVDTASDKRPDCLNERKQENVMIPVQRYECKVCQKSYKNKRHLYRHEKEECIGIEPKFRCEICMSMFRRKYHLSRHLFNRHGVDVKLMPSEMDISAI